MTALSINQNSSSMLGLANWLVDKNLEQTSSSKIQYHLAGRVALVTASLLSMAFAVNHAFVSFLGYAGYWATLGNWPQAKNFSLDHIQKTAYSASVSLICLRSMISPKEFVNYLSEAPIGNCYPAKSKEAVISAELEQELENRLLETSGKIPDWLSGALIRNGPIQVTINGESNAHWFDGLAMLHAFSFHEGKVNYSNKFLRSDDYHKAFDNRTLSYGGFASDPCRSLFKKFLSFFISNSNPAIQNGNVNVGKLADAYVALTEVPLPVKFDRTTLETLGVLDFEDELPKDKCWESAHPHYDILEKKTLNYLIKFGWKSYYTLYSLEDGSAKRKIIAEVPVEEPSYMHSFAVTENYIVLTEFPLVVKPLDLIIKNQAFIKNFSWQPQRGTQFIVIDKHHGNVVGKYRTKPFFAFHHANAYESDGTILIDIVTYKDAGIITGDALHVNSDLASNHNYPSQLERFSLALKTGEITSDVVFSSSHEFPRMNEKLDGKPYRYLYLAAIPDESAGNKKPDCEGLYKINTQTKEILEWSENGCSAGEPVFVPAPEAVDEDEGVVLALILDHIHNDSFLLVLDAKSFHELGRARVPHLIPAGFHGQYFK